RASLDVREQERHRAARQGFRFGHPNSLFLVLRSRLVDLIPPRCSLCPLWLPICGCHVSDASSSGKEEVEDRASRLWARDARERRHFMGHWPEKRLSALTRMEDLEGTRQFSFPDIRGWQVL